MRSIKFRAWRGTEMIYQADDSSASAASFFNRIYGQHIVMQFTGLKDKNGKEIFEGDIVSAWSDGYNHKGEIRWMLSGTPRIIIYPAFANQGFWGLHGSERKEGDMIIDVTGKLEVIKGKETQVIDDGVEVIGNIFQNSDLLK